MDLSAINTSLSSFTEAYFTIIIGIFVTLAVMGIATLYDKRKSEKKTVDKVGESKSSINLSQKVQDLNNKCVNKLSEYTKKFRNKIPKNVKKNNLEKSEISPLKPTTWFQKAGGTLKSKISNLLFTLRSKQDKVSRKEPVLEPNKKVEASKLVEDAKISSIDIDKTVDLKNNGPELNDNVSAQISTASSSRNNEAVVLNTDPALDKSENDVGLGGLREEPTEKDPLSSSSIEKIVPVDKTDSFLDSLKKDIVIKKEKKIDFMTEMQGENLDLKLIKSDLQEVHEMLKKFRQYSHNN